MTAHYILIREFGKIDKAVQISMHCKTLLLKEKLEDGDAGFIRAMLNSILLGKYGINLATSSKSYKMVTDCAAVMDKVAGSSVSFRFQSDSTRWMGCVLRQINTAMKAYLNAMTENDDLGLICRDLNSVKLIVRVFKQIGLNGKLPYGYHLIQDVETRFGSSFLVLQRFLKSADLIEYLLSTGNHSTALSAFRSLQTSVDEDGKVIGFPA